MLREGLVAAAGLGLMLAMAGPAHAARGEGRGSVKGMVGVTPGPHPRLVFARDEIPSLKMKAETPEGRAIVARLRALLKGPEDRPDAIDAGFHAAGHGLLYVLTGDEAEARAARRLVDLVTSDAVTHRGEPLWDSRYKAIMRTDPAVGVALAYDLCFDAWDEAYRRDLAAKLEAKARDLLKGGGEGWNPSPNSNWHANTRSGAGICAMAVLGDPGGEGAERDLARAVQGIRDWMAGQIGDRGWTQESLAYYRYPTTHHLLPFIRICRGTVDPAGFAGTAADWITLFYLYLLIPGSDQLPIVNPGGEADFDQGRWHAGEFALGFGTVPERLRPALLWLYERRHGFEGDGTFDVFLPHHAIFALADWPVGTKPVDPDELLDRAWVDRKRGLVLLRNRWQDADDFVACIDANVGPQSGTGKPRCAGGFALSGFDTAWAWTPRPSKNRARSEYNVVLAPGMNETGGGRIVRIEARPGGSGTVEMDLAEVYGAPATRTVSVIYGACGATCVMTVHDRVAGDGAKVWQMHTGGGAEADGAAFTIHGKGGAVLSGRVLAPEGAAARVVDGRIEVEAPAGPAEFRVEMTVSR